MKEYYITNDKGENFVITNYNSDFKVYKIVDNKRVPAQNEDIKYILNQLNSSLKSYKEILDTIKQLILKGQIKDELSLKQFIETTPLSDEEKRKIYEEGLGELQIADIISLKDKIINQIRKYDNDSISPIVEFQVHNNSFGEKYCDIKLSFADEFSKVEHLKEVMTYNDTLKTELIEPILLEVAIKSPVVAKNLLRTSNAIDNRGDLFINTQDKTNVIFKNGDYDHLEEINKKIDALKYETSIENEEQRDNKIEEMQDKQVENGQSLTDNNGVIYNEYGEIIGYVDANALEKGKGRVRKKDGYSNALIIIAITSMISSLLIIMQIFLLNR